MNVTAKFRCQMKEAWPPGMVPPESTIVRFDAVVTGPENQTWAAATPAGQITMTVNNQVAADAFEVGREYLLTFEAAP